jgi:hypothetical protein
MLLSTTLVFAQNGVWAVVSSPNQGTSNNQLLSVAPASASEVWAVGFYNAGPFTNSLRTLGERWNGSNWSIVSTPNAATGNGDYDTLQGIARVSSSNLWAVGYSGSLSAAADQTLIEHWDGSSWSIVSSSNPYTSQELYGVGVVSSSDIWAVGQYLNLSPSQHGALIEHWNGTAWSSVSNPATEGLYGVTALSSNNIWAVGGSQVLHWNGTSWSSVTSPQPPNGDSYQLRSATAISSGDIWAAGYEEVASGDGFVYDPLLEHWDGSSWTLVSGANPNAGTTSLYGITALSSTSVWAVGVTGGLSFIEQWDGTQWTRVSSPNVGTSNNTLQAVAAIPSASDLWAVGEYYLSTSPFQSQTLVEQCTAC